MRKINLKNALKQLDELKRVQGEKDSIGMLVGEVTRLGTIRAVIHQGQPKNGRQKIQYFENLRSMLTEPGITENTVIIMDDMPVCSDLYLPADPILFYCTKEQIQSFIFWAESGDLKKWLCEYYQLCFTAREQGLFIPDTDALNDLMANFNRFPVETLVERYKNQKWFVPYARPVN